MSIRILKGLYRFTVYIVGVCVLFAAVAATMIRLFLPDIGMYRSEIEAWVSNYMSLPVAIRTLEADWQGWTPYLYLEDIDLLNRAGTTPIINFESAQVSIDPLATLLQRRIVPERLIISGFELVLTRAKDGSIDIEGLETGNGQQRNGGNDELAAWLLSQRLIELQHVKIEWRDETLAQLPVLLSDVNLILRSDGRRLQMEGSSHLPSMYGDSFAFSADIRGNLLTADWSAEFFVEGKNINPDFWYRAYWPADLNLVGGNATITMWSSWQRARPVGMKGRLNYDNFEFVSDNGGSLKVKTLSAWLNSRENSDRSWTLNLDIDQFITQNGEWEPVSITLLAEPAAATYTLNFNYLKLDDLYPVLSSLSFLPKAAAKFITEYPLRGHLSESRIRYKKNGPENQQLAFDIRLEELDSPLLGKAPSFKGLSARVQGTLDNGRIRFSHDDVTVEYASAEKQETIPLQIDGDLAWFTENNGYVLYTNLLQLQNQDINARLAGSAGITEKCCRLNLIAEAEATDVDALISNLPYTSGFKLRDWLQKSVSKGIVQQAVVLYRGNTENFPFDQHAGVFEMLFDVSGTELKYSANWPSIENIDGRVAFSGRTMTIDIDKGFVFNAPIETAVAVIPDLFPRQKILNIDGRINGSTADVQQYILQSPLGDNQALEGLAKAFSKNGTVGLDLELMVPLRSEKPTEVTGNLQLAGTTLTTGLKDMQFTDIAGSVQFTRHTIDASDIVARYDNQPIRLSIQSTDTSGNVPVTVSMTGSSDSGFITSQLNRYLSPANPLGEKVISKLTGTADWQASLTFAKNSAAGIERTLQISSDLYGMNVNLPDPLAKHAYLRTRLEISKNLDNGNQPLTIRYGNIMTSEVLLDDQNGLRKVDINFGNRTYRYSDHQGILLYGQVDQLALDEWFALLKPDMAGTGSDTPAVQADLAINDLHIFGQIFSNMTLNLLRGENSWDVRLGGADVKGSLTIPAGQDKEQPIIADLDYLHLKKGGPAGDTPNRIVPSKLPSITAHVDSFRYEDLDLGEMEFVAGAAEYGLYIDTLSFTKPSFTIEAKGKWNGTDTDNNSSDFTIQAHASELDRLLQTFGYDVNAVKNGETNVAIDANWEGTPTDFSLNRLNGTLGIRIGKGQLLDIKPAAGRLFGLLSLQTLPRRLTLDFSDLFGDGMAFDFIQGNFIIRNGNAYTNDLTMKGPSVDILISGRTGLSTHDYDQIAIVTPQISDSLAVASGFLGPMGLGIGTVLYFAGNLFEPLQDSINNIMKFQYSISGSWNDPVIEKFRQIPASRG